MTIESLAKPKDSIGYQHRITRRRRRMAKGNEKALERLGNLPVTAKQHKFLTSKERIVMFVGGVGSGKTLVLCIRAIMSAFAGRDSCVVSYSYPCLRDVIIPTMDELLEKLHIKHTYNKNEKRYTINGTRILLRSADKPKTLRGPNLADIFIDEAAYVKEEAFDVLIGRMRTRADAQMYICTTPKGRDNWVFKKSAGRNTRLITQSTFENPFIPREYKKDLLMRYTDKFSAQELFGEFVDFSGGVIEADRFHIITTPPIEAMVRYWDFAVSVKKSADFTASCKAAMDVDGNMYILDVTNDKVPYPQTRRRICQTSVLDGTSVEIGMEEAGQQRGFIDDIATFPELNLHSMRGVKQQGDKLSKCLPWISKINLRKVFLVRAPWNEPFIEQCKAFTPDDSHKHDDMIDAACGAYYMMAQENAPGLFVMGPPKEEEPIDEEEVEHVARVTQWKPRGQD